MLRIIFTMFLISHGLLHLIGFAKEWQVTSLPLSRKILVLTANPSRMAGVLWLTACLLFVGAGLSFLMRRDWFWVPAAAGVLVSQILIVIYWNDFKYGTWINVLLVFAVLYSAAAMRFNRITEREAQSIMGDAHSGRQIITEEMLTPLPANVAQWLRNSGVVGKQVSDLVVIKQKGLLRTAPDGRWMPFSARQYFSFDPPAFLWKADIEAAPLVRIAGRDKLSNGQGNMLIRPLYLFTAANSSGPEIDQGALLRYLAEIAWFPHAALSQYVTWESIDDHRARATLRHEGNAVSGIYFFDASGRVTGFEALRYGDFGGTFRQEQWSVAIKDYRRFNGILIGSACEVTWKLAEGDFTWLKVTVTDVKPWVR